MKFIDLFSGIGGFRLGFESKQNTCVFSADFDTYACETYSKNFKVNPLLDITTVDEKQIPDHDLLTAGFPCQPFSIAGFRKGFEDVRGTLFFDIYRILNEKRPKVFVLENVKGLINHDKGNTFKTMLNYLAKSINGKPNSDKFEDNLGYDVYWKILNASDFGVPQNRERVFIVGFRDKVSKFEFPTFKGKKKTFVLYWLRRTYLS
jgi:DNA (cytosine-5)-methyltransferase 1